jgi:hypothetical protein
MEQKISPKDKKKNLEIIGKSNNIVSAEEKAISPLPCTSAWHSA